MRAFGVFEDAVPVQVLYNRSIDRGPAGGFPAEPGEIRRGAGKGEPRRAHRLRHAGVRPFAYTHFCLRHRQECRVQGRAFRRPRLEELSRVNREVNRAIAPRQYVSEKTFDTWRIAPKAGDCNDYAVSKRHELLARGWPSRTLLLSEVVTPWGEHHLILVVRTDRGNLVLDNLNPQIRHWSRTPYSWVRMPLPDQPSLWATIKEPRPSAVS